MTVSLWRFVGLQCRIVSCAVRGRQRSEAPLSTALKPTSTHLASHCATRTRHSEQPWYPQSEAKPSIRHEAFQASSLALSIPAFRLVNKHAPDT
ncbi:hypothetical protein J6590_088522 [Homalodisca vitripennis]|nr:hypothetical protein J6590_088522 [Homalodisca vitripennis]